MKINTDELLSVAQAAAYLGFAYDSMRRLKRTGTGPRYIQITPRSTFYRVSDLDAFLKARAL